MQIKSYRDLDVWKLAREFAREIYEVTSGYPAEERYGLTSQTRRAAVSIMSNIAEGSGRRSAQEFARFTNIASGSVCEVEAQLLLATDLKYVEMAIVEIKLQKADRISKMLYALHQSLTAKAAA